MVQLFMVFRVIQVEISFEQEVVIEKSGFQCENFEGGFGEKEYMRVVVKLEFLSFLEFQDEVSDVIL